ncbi:putative vesicle transport protein SFT2B-like [Trypanosoma rangeli]|uniref:Vesicle transport protein n=1 Tax=Trypanosoma rangeli TaxID=5698 RepID=A0A422NJC0_TRYRA|nr:putative vesicle transport protein SFT2B-like [Trypanosoma rangeli]RNF05556.1 putative vesicle transport protein SFT2B-like [Trypanosoma rangeli]|eukprot:RNF05556.1 putative vesicle transport protein SFT2B-like [Trypanosoma rangeli]
MDKLTSVVSVVSNSGVTSALGGGGVIEAEESESLCPSLSWKHRLIGCGCCVGLGMFFSLLSFIAILQMDLVLFSVLFSFGNVVSIAGLLFLAGPMAQLQRMFDEKRWIATTVYLVSIVLTILCALLLHNALLVLVCCLVQTGAMIWYVLSYIPFARDAVKSCFGRIMR